MAVCFVRLDRRDCPTVGAPTESAVTGSQFCLRQETVLVKEHIPPIGSRQLPPDPETDAAEVTPAATSPAGFG